MSKLVKSLPPKTNTVIPLDWIEKSPMHYQAHLERIGDYLLQGPGGWWRYIDTGVEFYDIKSPSIPPATPTLHYFRTTSMNDVNLYLLKQWEECLEKGVSLPAKYIRTYAADGNVLEVQSCSGFITPSTEDHVNHSTVSLTPYTTAATECHVQESLSLTPCRPTCTGTEDHVNHSTVSLTPCTTPCHISSLTPRRPIGIEQQVLWSHKSKDIAPQNTQLSSVGKCILSVAPTWMQAEVFAFDTLRNKVKALRSQNKTVTSLLKDKSATIQDHLIQEYHRSQKQTAKNNSHSGLEQKLQHKLNVLRKLLDHEWRVKF